MSDFKYVYGESLEHFGFGKQADKHMYTAREWVKGKWRYVYDNGKKAADKVQNTAEDVNKNAKTSVRLAKNTINNTIGINQKKKVNNLQSKYESDIEKRDKAREAYQKNRYTDEEYYRDLEARGYDRKINERKDVEKSMRDIQNEKATDREFKEEYNNWLSSPESGADARYFFAKLAGDEARHKRAQKLANDAIKSRKDLEAAQLAYDKTLLGKTEKGLSIIKNLFSSMTKKKSESESKGSQNTWSSERDKSATYNQEMKNMQNHQNNAKKTYYKLASSSHGTSGKSDKTRWRRS